MVKVIGSATLIVAALTVGLLKWKDSTRKQMEQLALVKNCDRYKDVPSRPSPGPLKNEVNIESLCQRMMRAAEQGDEVRGVVYRKIVSQLGRIESDELLGLLADLEGAGCDQKTKDLEYALISALACSDRVVAADYLVGRHGEDIGIEWGMFADGFFSEWVREDLLGMMTWLDGQPGRFSSVVRPMMMMAETTVMTAMIQSDTSIALERAAKFSHETAVRVVGGALTQRSDLLEPDVAIEFLREALGSRDHEEFVGRVCGQQLHSKSFEELGAFFEKHDASLLEREAILAQAVDMQVNIREVTDEYLNTVRAFASKEGLRNLDRLTVHIIATRSDRDHDDELAVDQLLELDPDAAALRLFFEMRESSIDEAQAERILERINTLTGP